MKIVLDTNTVISGLLWKGAPRQVLDLARADSITIFTSPELTVGEEPAAGHPPQIRPLKS